jgi:hypothetical protein
MTYPGSAPVFLLFNLCFFALVALAFPRPRLYGYTFLAIFVTMGFWAKTWIQCIWAPGFLEPVGDFRNAPEQWDGALMAMSAAVLGLILVRGAYLVYRRRDAAQEALPGTPPWFARHRAPLWVATVVAVLGVNAANLHFAFFQIGVNPKLLLPLRLHVVAAWLVNIGFALWIAALLWWEHGTEPRRLGVRLFAPLLEAFVSAASTFSRILYLIHTVPYWFALWERRRDFRNALEGRQVVGFGVAFLALFAAATVSVFALRLHYYPMIDRTTGAVGDPSISRNMARELPQLVVQRWIGLEGVLAAGSASGRGWPLLVEGVTDSPKRGSESLFQQIAKLTPYRTDPKAFTFLTNAGPVAILHLSGSLAVVLLGMAAIGALVLATEEAARVWIGNPFLLAVSGAALANVVAQTTFFYLTVIFLAQLWIALACLGALQRLRWRS